MQTIPTKVQERLDLFEKWIKGLELEHDPKKFPSKVLHYKKNEEGRFHNLKGPAVVTQDAVYFVNNGKDWTDEEYNQYIKTEIRKIDPSLQTSLFPISQLISIVHTAKNWGTRAKLPYQAYPDIDNDYVNPTRVITKRKRAKKK